MEDKATQTEGTVVTDVAVQTETMLTDDSELTCDTHKDVQSDSELSCANEDEVDSSDGELKSDEEYYYVYESDPNYHGPALGHWVIISHNHS